MAHPLHIANGLILDYAISGAGGSDAFLLADANGNVTSLSSIPVARLTAQTALRAAAFDGSGILTPSATTSTELSYVSGVTSSIQTQLNAKQALISLTANRLVISDGAGSLTVSPTTATEASYLSGVSSAIQTQLNGKQATITGGASTIVSSNLTASLALVSDGSGKVAVSAVTATELGYVSGVTSALQTQLGTKLTVTLTSPVSGNIITYNGSTWVNSAAPAGTLPVGGVANQYLTKIDGTNYNTQWTTLTATKITDLTATASEINILHTVTTTTAQLNYLNTATSNIQTQLNNKLGNALSLNAVWVGNVSNLPGEVPAGSEGQVFTISAGVPSWQTTAGTGTVTSVAISGGTTGLTTSGGPITTTGTITFAGTLIAANGGTSFASYTTGDLLYASGATALSKLAIGTNGYILTVAGGVPTWAAASSVGWAVSGATTITGNTNQTGAFNNTFNLNKVAVTQNAMSSAWVSAFVVTPGGHTALTASTEFIDVDFAFNRSETWAAGTVATQRQAYFRGVTLVGASATATFTDAYTVYIDAPTAGANASITRKWALGVNGNMAIGNPNASAFFAIRSTGATTGSLIRVQNSTPSTLLFMQEDGSIAFVQVAESASWTTAFKISPGAHTAITNTAENIDFDINLNRIVTWAGSGTVTTQRQVYFRGATLAGASAQTFTNAYTVFIDAPTAGTNATITNKYALGIGGDFVGTGATFKMSAPNGTLGLVSSAGESLRVQTTGNVSIGTTTDSARLYVLQPPLSSAWTPLAKLDGGAHTAITASTELHDVNINLSRIVQWSTGTLTTQRAVRIQAPTYAFVGASMLTNAYTFYVDGSPAAGVNATITNSFTAGFGGKVQFNQTTTTSPIQIVGFTSDPSAPVEGEIAYNTTSHLMKYYNGTGWIVISATLSGIGAATSSNTIDNLANAQEWDWNSLTSGTAFTISSTNTGAASNSQKLLFVNMLGLNSTSSQTTIAADIQNGHGGTGAINKALRLNSANGATNYALEVAGGDLLFSSTVGANIKLDTTVGTKIGTSTSQKISFWNATPIVQPTTAIAASSFVANTSLIANDSATWDGYTAGQVVKALRNFGILA